MRTFLFLLCLGLLASGVTSYYGYGARNNNYYGARNNYYDPYAMLCKSGYYLKNPMTRGPFFCGGFWRQCPWPRWFKCESMTGSDDGFGVCCFDRGDV